MPPPDPREGFIRGKPGEMYGLPVKIDLRSYVTSHEDLDPETRTIKCQEASSLSHRSYMACGETATKLVLSERGTRLYFMCDACASHNIAHRGAVLIAVHEEMKV